MLKSIWLAIWGAKPLDFEAVISPWTGPVTWISFGPTNQNILVSIDFRYILPEVWKKCLPFVPGGCASLPAGADQREHSLEPENIQLGSMITKSILGYSDGFDNGFRGLDVAGLIGAAPESPIFASKTIVVTVSGSRMRFREVQSTEEWEFCSPVRRRWDSPPPSIWLLKAGLHNQYRHRKKIIFALDLAQTDIVIPHEKLPELAPFLIQTEQYKLNGDGRIFLRCNVSKPFLSLNFMMDTEDISEVSVEVPLLLESSDKLKWCASRIVTREDATMASIGPALFSGVDSLVFDFKSQRIGLSVNLIAPKRPVAFESVLPVFSLNHLLESNVLTFPENREPTVNDPGLILMSLDPTKRSIPEKNVHLTCWTFAKVYISAPQSAADIAGSFDDVEFSLNGKTAEFIFKNYDADDISRNRKRATIIYESDKVEMCQLQWDKFELVEALPEQTVAEHDDHLIGHPCAVCHNEFEVGNTLQPLRQCSHLFHKDCVLEWVLNRDNRCPLRKTEIEKRLSRSDDSS